MTSFRSAATHFLVAGLLLAPVGVSAQVPADFDRDGDVDLADYLEFARCFVGSGGALPADCLHADLDGDGDADLVGVDRHRAVLPIRT